MKLQLFNTFLQTGHFFLIGVDLLSSEDEKSLCLGKKRQCVLQTKSNNSEMLSLLPHHQPFLLHQNILEQKRECFSWTQELLCSPVDTFC